MISGHNNSETCCSPSHRLIQHACRVGDLFTASSQAGQTYAEDPIVVKSYRVTSRFKKRLRSAQNLAHYPTQIGRQRVRYAPLTASPRGVSLIATFQPPRALIFSQSGLNRTPAAHCCCSRAHNHARSSWLVLRTRLNADQRSRIARPPFVDFRALIRITANTEERYGGATRKATT
jgi:hypothetical protein